MKSATVSLVALTVFTTLFLESSTAAVDSTTSEGTIKVDEPVKRFLDGAMKFSERIIASGIQDTVNALATAEDETKENVTKANIWLKNLLALCKELHNEMNIVLANGSIKRIRIVTTEISGAIVTKRAEWSEISETLAKLVELKENLDEKMKVNFANADVIEVTLKELLSDGNNTSVA